MTIKTFDSSGNPNGLLFPLWNAKERPDLRPEQVYVTTVAPHTRKGPHLHFARRGMFVLVSGAAVLRTMATTELNSESRLSECEMVRGEMYQIPPGTAAALYNRSDTEAVVINLPSPAWSKDNPDDWPVSGWSDPAWWGTQDPVDTNPRTNQRFR